MPALHIDREELVALNDQRLGDLVRADGAAVEREIERTIAEARPVIDGVLGRYSRSGSRVTREDAEDIRSTIHLRLVLKLRSVARDPEEAIQNLRGYVATLAYNAVHDHLRKRFPERTNLKTRLRYALTHDPRLTLWTAAAGPVCGLAGWEGREDAVDELPQLTISAIHAVIAGIDRGEAGNALEEIFRITQKPVLFDETIDVVAAGWNIVDRDPAPLEEIRDIHVPATRAEDLDFARALWAEIRELRPMQRKALLLNLRYGGDSNIVSLLILGRIARFDEIAAALEMSPAELASVWRGLPLEDNAIAERFGITRQQVINLRKAARERLSRRLRR